MNQLRVKTEALVPKKKGPAPKLFQNERCRICAESAEGVNYNAISCMACKAFYRRVVVAGKELRLIFNYSNFWMLSIFGQERALLRSLN